MFLFINVVDLCRMLSENFGIQQQGNIVCIGSVAVSMLASSAVDLGTTSGQVIAKTIIF
jgi:hypothetical protein